jgi:hypothetical protein
MSHKPDVDACRKAILNAARPLTPEQRAKLYELLRPVLCVRERTPKRG